MDAKEKARLKKYEKTYGKEGAKVRNRIFKRILKNNQDGTKAGQWSARKSQSLVEDYEKEMGEKGKKAYKSSKKTKSQKSLKKWGDQKWRTKSGKKSSKTGERYLPEKAIKALTDEEYKKTSAKKRKDMKKGKQFSDQPKKIAKKTSKYRTEDWGDDVDWEDGDDSISDKLRRPKEWDDIEWNAEGYYQVYLYYGGEYPNEIRYARTFREARDIEYRSGAEHSEIVNPQGNVVDSQTGKEYPPLVFDAESRPRSVEIKRSSNPEKKLMAVFEDKDGKKIKTTHFGQRGASDYTKHGDKERMKRYLERHGGGTTTSTKENWKDPTTAGALSRWVLWNKPSLSGSFSDFKSRFNLKGDLEVSKSAETVKESKGIQFYSGVVVGLGAFLALRAYFRNDK